MDTINKQIYDDFYVGYFDAAGNIIYPSDLEEVKMIRQLLKNVTSNNMIYVEEKDLHYKVRIKRKIVDGTKVQVVELSNVTDLLKKIATASVDEITHLHNRKITRDLFMQYIEDAARNGEEFTVVFADLDGFKQVNDTYGHINGDIVLGEISRILYSYTRRDRKGKEDIVTRLGGDEFLIIFKNSTEEFAYEQTEKIRLEVEQRKVQLFDESGEVTYISPGTLSIGFYHVRPQELIELYNKGNITDHIRTVLLDRCDSALYTSKHTGKNKITKYEGCPKVKK